MRGQGLLGVVGLLLIAVGAIACYFEAEWTDTSRNVQDSVQAPRVRQPPLAKAPLESSAEGSGQVGICEPGASPVMIVVVESPRKVKSASALWKDTPIVVEEPETVVFADGRIVTSRLEATGAHLQSLGWTHRDIELVGGLPAATGAWQRRRG